MKGYRWFSRLVRRLMCRWGAERYNAMGVFVREYRRVWGRHG